MRPVTGASSIRRSLPGMDPLPGRLAAGDPSLRAGIPLSLALLLILISMRCAKPLAAQLRAARTQSPNSAAAAAQVGSASPSPSLSVVFSPSVLAWSDQILQWSHRYQLDPDLIATVMQIESCGDPTAVSSAGAAGLFQVMPFHFLEGENPFHPEDNARRGLSYLAACLAHADGEVALALAAYNGGQSLLALPTERWPAETRRYVMWGTSILREIRAGTGESPTLRQWLAAGGESLCRRAASQPSLPASIP